MGCSTLASKVWVSGSKELLLLFDGLDGQMANQVVTKLEIMMNMKWNMKRGRLLAILATTCLPFYPYTILIGSLGL